MPAELPGSLARVCVVAPETPKNNIQTQEVVFMGRCFAKWNAKARAQSPHPKRIRMFTQGLRIANPPYSRSSTLRYSAVVATKTRDNGNDQAHVEQA